MTRLGQATGQKSWPGSISGLHYDVFLC